MSTVGELIDRKDRPAYVRFERVAVEDKAASLEKGHYVAKDIDYANITPPYSKDVFKIKVIQWFKDLEQQIANQRIPREWAEDYKKSYQMWKNGQEMPLNGTPIRGWGVISPAQQETLIRMNILTVEDLSLVNDEGLRRIGMGAMELKNKADGWLRQLNDKGPMTQEISALKNENKQLRDSLENMGKQIEQLRAQIQKPVIAVDNAPSIEISVKDILEDTVMKGPDTDFSENHDTLVARYIEKFGKKPHHKMKDETIKEALK
jgi:hypothetical protein